MVRKERRAALRDALTDLERYARMFERPRFLGDRDAQRLVLQAMYVAVQACIDEAMEVCEEAGIGHGETYREVFLALGNAGLLDPTLAGQMSGWASFRNVLAHFYPVLDLERTYAALADVPQLRAFEAWLLARSPAAPAPDKSL